ENWTGVLAMGRCRGVLATLIVLSLLVTYLPTRAQIASADSSLYVDLGNPSSEAGHNLQGWGGTQPNNPFVSPSGDNTKRFQSIRGDNTLTLSPTVPGATYQLTTEVEDGGCSDNFNVL